MDSNKYEGTGYIIVGLIMGALLTWSIMEYNHMQVLKNFEECKTNG